MYKTSSVCTRGGIEEVIQQLTLETTALGVNNRVICLSKDYQTKTIIKTKWATVYCYPLTVEVASCGFSWALLKEFKGLTAWADVVHNQFPWPFADMLALICQNKNTPYIISYQSDIVRQSGLFKLYKPLMNRYLRGAKAIIASSPKYIESSPVLNKLNQPVQFIPNGIGESQNAESYQIDRERIKKTHGDSFFLFIGVFRYYKGISYLLAAAKETGLPVILVGSGAEEDEIRKYIKVNDLHNVSLLGNVSDSEKYALISLAAALVLPSSERSEAYGMVLVEAARQGLAMISTELGSGTSYINIHNKTGLVVPPKNSKELSKAMCYMTNNPDTVKQMGELARQRFKQYFTASQMGTSYVDLYQQVLNDSEIKESGR